jgi:hypothetical protein
MSYMCMSYIVCICIYVLPVGEKMSYPEVQRRALRLISSPMKIQGRKGSNGTYAHMPIKDNKVVGELD